jgi:hypothetical protein
MSRHITGAYSLQQLNWDDATKTLSGTSQGVIGDPYTLWIYVPDGEVTSRVSATIREDQPIEIRELQCENSLSVTFLGQKEPVQWKVLFKAKGRK